MKSKALALQHLVESQALLYKLALFTLLAAALMFGSGHSLAAEKHEHSKMPKHEKSADAGKSDMRGHMMEDLKLDDKQREAFKNAMMQRHESMSGMRDTHDQLRELEMSDNYDENKVRELIRKDQKEREDSIVKSSKAMNDFYKTLNAEQKEKFKKMRAEMKDRMKDGMRERMKGGGMKQCDTDQEMEMSE